RLHIRQEAFDAGAQRLRLRAEGAGDFGQASGGVAGFAGGAGDGADALGDHLGAAGRLLDAADDLLRGGTLLLDRGRDRVGDLVDLLDDRRDALDRRDRALGLGLDRADMAGDLVGRLRGLAREVLHLGGDHGEALAGIARAGGFDGGIECEEVCLARDLVDQLHDGADLFGGGGEALDLLVGGARLVRGFARDLIGLRDLPRDLADRGRELAGGAGDRADAAGGLRRGLVGVARLAGGLLGAARHRGDGILHGMERGRDIAQTFGHLGVEVSAEPLQRLAALALRFVRLVLLGGELLGPGGVLL